MQYAEAWRSTRHEYWRLAAEVGGSDAVVSMAGESRGGIKEGMTRYSGRAESPLTRDLRG